MISPAAVCSFLLALPAASLTASAEPAQPNKKSPKKQPAPCSAPAHRQFDFWIGDWEVRTPDGKVAGNNRIERILGGCVLMENWRSASGKSVGHSFNVFGADGKWHQTWVDNQGLLLELVGGLDKKGTMVMSQDTTGPDGKPIRHEISWTRLSKNEVRQHWRISKDGGKKYTDAFIGRYVRTKSKSKNSRGPG